MNVVEKKITLFVTDQDVIFCIVDLYQRIEYACPTPPTSGILCYRGCVQDNKHIYTVCEEEATVDTATTKHSSTCLHWSYVHQVSNDNLNALQYLYIFMLLLTFIMESCPFRLSYQYITALQHYNNKQKATRSLYISNSHHC